MARIELIWQDRGAIACLLWPVSVFYRTIVACRRLAYRFGMKSVKPVTLPVIVVGNISVGGTGKTPLCQYLVKYFSDAGWRPGIVSRGYGGDRHDIPHLLTSSDTPVTVGDEPMMLFEKTRVPVCVCVKRALAVEHLTKHGGVDLIFADDGLQHLAMSRCAEIMVVDGKRGFGNGWMLPAGPLREPQHRLAQADVIAVQSFETVHDSLAELIERGGHLVTEKRPLWIEDLAKNGFSLCLCHALRLSDGHQIPLSEFTGQSVIAMTGIGHPERFFDALRALGMKVSGEPRPDHHAYTLDDLPKTSALPYLVTSKDAVKLRALGELAVEIYEVVADIAVSDALQQRIAALEHAVRNKPLAKAP